MVFFPSSSCVFSCSWCCYHIDTALQRHNHSMEQHTCTSKASNPGSKAFLPNCPTPSNWDMLKCVSKVLALLARHICTDRSARTFETHYVYAKNCNLHLCYQEALCTRLARVILLSDCILFKDTVPHLASCTLNKYRVTLVVEYLGLLT